jgi:magnesium chelatase subunit H
MRWRAALSPLSPAAIWCAAPTILPTGRNIHAFDPFRMPTAFALKRRRGAGRPASGYPCHLAAQSVALVLWGSDNIKSDGGPIAQALALIGARTAVRPAMAGSAAPT